jgi:hypothetical protein
MIVDYAPQETQHPSWAQVIMSGDLLADIDRPCTALVLRQNAALNLAVKPPLRSHLKDGHEAIIDLIVLRLRQLGFLA